MTVSVALATYNGEKFVVEQLDSLREQTRKPDEVVIIDDRSTDGTVGIVREYILKHSLDWRLSVAESNSGYKRNFYNCLKATTGDVVFLCDQDDVWYPQKLEKIMSVFESDPDCLGVTSSFDMTDKKGDITVPFTAGKRTSNHGLVRMKLQKGECVDIDAKTVLLNNVSPGCTSAYRRSVVEEYLKTSDCTMPHDWELNVVAAKKKGLRFFNLPLIGYRQHGNNTIGLTPEEEAGFGPLKMTGTVEMRFRVLRDQQLQADMFTKNMDENDPSQRRFSKRLQQFCRNRDIILRKKRLWPCFKNLFLYPNFIKVTAIRFRAVVGDFLYVLKSKFKSKEQEND